MSNPLIEDEVFGSSDSAGGVGRTVKNPLREKNEMNVNPHLVVPRDGMNPIHAGKKSKSMNDISEMGIVSSTRDTSDFPEVQSNDNVTETDPRTGEDGHNDMHNGLDLIVDFPNFLESRRKGGNSGNTKQEDSSAESAFVLEDHSSSADEVVANDVDGSVGVLNA